MIPSFTVVYTDYDTIIVKSYPKLINTLQGLYLKGFEFSINIVDLKRVLLSEGVVDLYDYAGEFTTKTTDWYAKVKVQK